MERFFEIVLDSLKDASLDVVKVFPILFLAYLLVGFFTHHQNGKYGALISRENKYAPLLASFLGSVPQCGFSSVVSDLYSQKKVSLGTLIAVFTATSDEAIPIMIANPTFIPKMFLLIALKIVIAVIFGYLIDAVLKLIQKKKAKTEIVFSVNEEHEHGEHCEHHHCCADNIFLDALKHSLQISAYIFIATYLLNVVFAYFGTDFLTNSFTSNVYVQILLASLIGLIPNCVSSVLLVELYVEGVILFPAMLAGLCAGTGVGLLILFTKNRKHTFANIGIVFMQFLIGVVSGILISLLPIY